MLLSEVLVRTEVFWAKYNYEVHKKLVAMQRGDGMVTYADTRALGKGCGIKLPCTNLIEGLGKIAEWYKVYYIV